MYLTLLFFLLSTTVTSSSSPLIESRNLEGGDFTNFNSVVNKLTIPISLNIDDIEVLFLTAVVGDSGICRNSQINEGGDIFISATFLEDAVTIDGFQQPLMPYEIEILVTQLQFECIIPLVVTGDDNPDTFGDLTFTSTQATLSQKVLAYSPNFSQVPPLYAELSTCEADSVELTYEGDDLGSVGFVDITGFVLTYLENNPNLVMDEVEVELCGLANDLGNAIISLLVADIFTNTSSDFFVANPFYPDDEGVISALEKEVELKEGLESEEDNGIVNFTDSTNIIVDLLISNGTETDVNPINQVLELLLDPQNTSNFDPVLLLLEDLVDGLNLTDEGDIVDFDVLSLILTGDETLEFNFGTVLENITVINITFEVDSARLSLFPDKTDYIIPPFEAFGDYTVILDDINLNDFYLVGGFNIKIDASILATGDVIVIEEYFTLSLDWDGFKSDIGFFFPLDLKSLINLPTKPTVENVADCLLSSFPMVPVITGATIDHTEIGLDFSDFNDAIFVLAIDLVESFFPAYESVIPRALELVIASVITDTEFFNETECPAVDEKYDDYETYPYDFNEGLFNFFNDNADGALLEQARLFLDGINLTDPGLYVIGGKNPDNIGQGFTVMIPAIDGWQQNVSVYIKQLAFDGLILPPFNDASLFNVPDESEPQFTSSYVDVGSPEGQVTVLFVLNITAQPPYISEDADPNEVSPTPPDVFYEQNNTLEVRWNLDRIELFLDMLLTYTQYDVAAMPLRGLINIGCWGSRIREPGGIKLMDFSVYDLDVGVTCDCQTPIIQELADTMSNTRTWDDQYFFVGDILNRFGYLVVDLFSDDHFDHTIKISEEICQTNNYSLIQLPVYELTDPHADVAALLPYIALFLFAIIMPSIMARVLNHYGPVLIKSNKHKENRAVNDDLMKKLSMREENEPTDEEVLDGQHLTTSLHKNPLVHSCSKILIPITLVVNLALFIIGDTGAAVQINIEGQFFGVPYDGNNFRTLSVVTSVVQLLTSGGIALGILLLMLSIVWPYVKLILMALCWFLPTEKLSTEKRGRIIEMLDFLGRFSFAEFHFLVFVLVVFQLEGAAPDSPFFPEDDLFRIGLQIEPLIALFTFALAVLLSIVISNIMLVYQHNIEDAVRIRLREKHLKDSALVENALARDEEKIRLTEWVFTILEKEENHELKEEIVHHYSYRLTDFAAVGISLATMIALFSLFSACMFEALHIELYGLFAYMVKWAGNDKDYYISVFGLLRVAYESYPGSFIVYYVGGVFILTISLIPMIQSIVLATLLLKRFSVKQARLIAEVHHVLTVWCCIDVFVLAVTLTVMELPSVTGGLTGNLAFCEPVGILMEGIFEPMGFVSKDDVEAACLTMHSSIVSGGYLAVISVFFLNVANFLVSRLFYFYIADRERIMENERSDEQLNEFIKKQEITLKSYHKWLVTFRMIEIVDMETKKEEAEKRSVRQSKLSVEPSSLFHIAGAEDDKRSSTNPMFEPEDDLELKLTNFFNITDPKRVKEAQTLAKNACKKRNGLQKLNEKLMDQYGTTIPFDL